MLCLAPPRPSLYPGGGGISSGGSVSSIVPCVRPSFLRRQGRANRSETRHADAGARAGALGGWRRTRRRAPLGQPLSTPAGPGRCGCWEPRGGMADGAPCVLPSGSPRPGAPNVPPQEEGAAAAVEAPDDLSSPRSISGSSAGTSRDNSAERDPPVLAKAAPAVGIMKVGPSCLRLLPPGDLSSERLAVGSFGMCVTSLSFINRNPTGISHHPNPQGQTT